VPFRVLRPRSDREHCREEHPAIVCLCPLPEAKPLHPSFWIESTPETDYPTLTAGISVDVAIVGAGITGLTAAALLRRAGKTVAVVEAKRIVEGATGYTTAKVTAGHGVIYSELEEVFGRERARTYAEANQAALERISRFVEEDGIDCDYERKPNYVYAESGDERPEIEAEVEAAKRCGLDVSFAESTPLPYEVAGAVRLDSQAQFHPRKYLLALAGAIPGDGSHVFELTRALDIDAGRPCEVRTDRGTLRAREVILATHLPFLDRGLFFAKTYPHRSYAVAAPIDEAHDPDGMFINSGTPTRSVRTIRVGERLLVQVGGNGHKTGEEPDTPRRYRELEEFLRQHWPEAGPVEFAWSTQDYMSLDRVPYVGALRRRSPQLTIATGFNKWGMTNGTVAAMILTDRILEQPNDWAELFDSKRLNRRAARKLVKEGASVGLHFFGDRLRRAERDAANLERGEGAIVRRGGQRRAAYRDEAGTLHVLSPVCRHLGCLVSWNAAERSWDCPCHGSRYTGEGQMIQGPTVKDLERIE
jgi:glycine/D-amino acid oxidase-like deaminating enzyme/nitrite reductase/ring-hydroxylating ferredoxin subunit